MSMINEEQWENNEKADLDLKEGAGTRKRQDVL